MRHPTLSLFSLCLSFLLNFLERDSFIRPRVHIEPYINGRIYRDYIGCPGTMSESALSTVENRDGRNDDS